MKRLLQHVRPPWRRPRRLVLVLVALVLLSGAAGAWLLLRDDAPAAAASTTATVATQTFKETVTASGTVAAATTADLAFPVSGTVTDVFVQPGDKVRKGQKLAAIDDTVLRAELAAAQSSLDAAQAAQSEHLSDGSSVEQTAADEAAVVAAESSLAQAEEAVDDAVLRSTTAGTVTAVGLEVDDTVGTGGAGGNADTSTDTSTGTSTGTITVVSTGRFVVEASVASGDVEKVTQGLQAEVTVSGIDGTVYGTVQEVGLVAETDSNGAAVFPVTIAITDERDDLFAGTSADLAIIVSQRADVLSVDSRAVQNDGDTTYVDKVTDAATGASTRTEIEIGETNGMATEVVSGLVAGDVVVVPGFAGPGGGGGNQEMQDMMRERIEQGGQLPPGGFIQGPGGAQ
ncbi:efflux RND transporter periplasmic adaptor subunit [Nocardioides sp. CPCC 206347]|uniref:efflux RND transporter periplasmic adaptor subunit n=1 Tax=unclassified Nocardioides TaxID=2615069 RepID=UPI003606FD98